MAPLRQEDDFYFEEIDNKKVVVREPEIVKKEKKKTVIKKHKAVKRVILATSAFSIALLIVYRYAMISNMNMENIKLKKELGQINNTNAQLQLAAEKSINLREVEKYAEEKLGLQKPQNYQIEYINVNKEDLIDNKADIENKSWLHQIVYNVIEFFN